MLVLNEMWILSRYWGCQRSFYYLFAKINKIDDNSKFSCYSIMLSVFSWIGSSDMNVQAISFLILSCLYNLHCSVLFLEIFILLTGQFFLKSEWWQAYFLIFFANLNDFILSYVSLLTVEFFFYSSHLFIAVTGFRCCCTCNCSYCIQKSFK